MSVQIPTIPVTHPSVTVFLWGLCVVIVIALADVTLDTYILLSPINWMLAHVKPPYGPIPRIQPHPYFATGILLTALTTLFLFFSNGLYSEKIGYANKSVSPISRSFQRSHPRRYVSHANRTLRSFNMYLNVRARKYTLRSLLSPQSPPPSPLPTQPPPQTPPPRRSSVPINPIPPPTNPRGELIFNTRVDKGFREGYERYRGAFEKRREERQREAEDLKASKSWWAWFRSRPAQSERTESPSPAPGKRGRANRTPTGSRRASPAGVPTKRRSIQIPPDANLESVPEKKPLEELRRTPTPSYITPPTTPALPAEEESDTNNVGPETAAKRLRKRERDRIRTESFSFLLGEPGTPVED